MCHACVIDEVKRRMLSGGGAASRRDALKGAAAGALAATGLAGATGAARAASHSDGAGAMSASPVDATHELHEGFPTYFGDQQFFMESVRSFDPDGFNVSELRMLEHTGTHVDAPLHFSADGDSVAEIPVANLVCPLVVIDIRAKAAEDADAQVTPDDLQAWIAAHGEIPDNACVAMLSGWGELVDTERFRNVRDEAMHFPGFHLEAAQMLLDDTSAAGIAVDTLSLDHGPSADFATHYAWLPAGRWGIECLANLESLPASGATLVVGAPKHRGGSGGPARVIALV